MFWFIFSIISGGFIVILAGRKQNRQIPEKDIPDRIYKAAGLLLSAVFVFLLFYRVTEIPTPYNVDEAGMAYDARSLAYYHVDRYLYHFPVYLINFGTGQSALYAYLTAVILRILGFSILSVRLPAILLSLVSMIVFVLTVRNELGNTAALILQGFFCILPFSIMHSRWGLDAYLLFPMLIISCSLLYVAVKSGKTVWFLAAGFSFGVTLYSYIISYMVVPIFLGVTLIYLLSARGIRWKHIFTLGLPLFVLAVPLMLMLAVNNNMIGDVHLPFISIPKMNGFRSGEIGLQNVLQNLKPDDYNIFYEIFANDHCIYNVNPAFGTLYYVSIPVLILGMICSGRRAIRTMKAKRFSFELMMGFLLVSSFFVSLIIERPNVNRSCAVYIPLIFFLSMGFWEILKKSKKLSLILSLIYLVSFSFFLRYYFHEFPQDLRSDILFTSINDLEDALDFSETVYKGDETVYILGRSNPYIYTILALDVDPYTFDRNKVLSYDQYVKVFDKYRFRLDAILPDCIYIFTNLNEIPDEIKNFDFSSEQFDSVIVYYPDESVLRGKDQS